MPCPICGNSDIKIQVAPNSYTFYKCPNEHNFGVAMELLNCDSHEQNRFFNMITEFIIRKPQYGNKYWCFYYAPKYKTKDTDEPQYINLSELENNYPTTFMEKVIRSLINLSKIFTDYNDVIDVSHLVSRLTYCKDINEYNETDEFLARLSEINYLNKISDYHYQFSSSGWIKIDELTKQKQTKIQGFIAMRFGSETKDIREAIKIAIDDADYGVMVIDEKEHNNQIVPEIFYEIENSSFLVVDITYPNYGAYYEAGYALGCGIEVIVCCKKDIIDHPEKYDNRPHFDISQKNMVPWEDLDDLKERLTRRIKATVNLKLL